MFAAQARWLDEQVALTGDYREWSRTADSGSISTYRFYPNCGSTVAYAGAGMPGLTAIAMGAFADPSFPPPNYSVYEERKHGWVAIIGDDIEHSD